MDAEQQEQNEVGAVLRGMPDDLKNEGVQYSQQLSLLYWLIGDWVNRVMVWAVAESASTSKKAVCAACAVVLNSDLGRDTLYEYSRVAAFYKSQRERRKYEVLPFSHLRYAMKFGETGYKTVLESDLASMDTHGGGQQTIGSMQRQYEPHLVPSQSGPDTMTATLPDDELSATRQSILDHLHALEGLIEKALVVDAESAVWIARAMALMNKAIKKLVDGRPEPEQP